jgi:fructose-1,6-bisphosphatase/inositol monophosphatase family enzyme
MVASGKLDGRIMLDPYGKDYDLLPGALLVAEAGGVVANIGSSNYDYKNFNFIAANPAVYHDLTDGNDVIFPLLKNNF